MNSRLNAIGARLSEDHLIKYDHKVLLLIILSFTLFIFLVIFKIHGSSISIWSQFIPNQSKESDGLIVGSPKLVRSDEWSVFTPFAISQFQSNPRFPINNENLGSENVPLITNIPTAHFSAIFRPQFWGYFFLDLERGFSFYWNFKVIGLFLSFFFVLMLLTLNNFWLSILGSLWVYFSSFTQWWFSIHLPELLTSFGMIFISLIYIVLSGKKFLIFFSFLLLTIFSINFCLFFYPPYQVLLGYLLLFLLIGFFYQRFTWGDFKNQINLKSVCLIGFLFVFMVVIYFYYIDIKGTLELMMNTLYPGKRRSSGGGISLMRYFSF